MFCGMRPVERCKNHFELNGKSDIIIETCRKHALLEKIVMTKAQKFILDVKDYLLMPEVLRSSEIAARANVCRAQNH